MAPGQKTSVGAGLSSEWNTAENPGHGVAGTVGSSPHRVMGSGQEQDEQADE